MELSIENEKWKSDQDKKMKNYRILIVCQARKKSVLLMPDQNTRLTHFLYIYMHINTSTMKQITFDRAYRKILIGWMVL